MPGNIVSELLVKIGLDSSDLKPGLEDAKSELETWKKTVLYEIIAPLTVAFSAKKLYSGYYNLGLELAKASRVLKTGVQDIQAYGAALHSVDGSMQDTIRTFKNLHEAQTGILDGTSRDKVISMGRLGVDLYANRETDEATLLKLLLEGADKKANDENYNRDLVKKWLQQSGIDEKTTEMWYTHGATGYFEKVEEQRKNATVTQEQADSINANRTAKLDAQTAGMSLTPAMFDGLPQLLTEVYKGFGNLADILRPFPAILKGIGYAGMAITGVAGKNLASGKILQTLINTARGAGTKQIKEVTYEKVSKSIPGVANPSAAPSPPPANTLIKSAMPDTGSSPLTSSTPVSGLASSGLGAAFAPAALALSTLGGMLWAGADYEEYVKGGDAKLSGVYKQIFGTPEEIQKNREAKEKEEAEAFKALTGGKDYVEAGADNYDTAWVYQTAYERQEAKKLKSEEPAELKSEDVAEPELSQNSIWDKAINSLAFWRKDKAEDEKEKPSEAEIKGEEEEHTPTDEEPAPSLLGVKPIDEIASTQIESPESVQPNKSFFDRMIDSIAFWRKDEEEKPVEVTPVENPNAIIKSPQEQQAGSAFDQLLGNEMSLLDKRYGIPAPMTTFTNANTIGSGNTNQIFNFTFGDIKIDTEAGGAEEVAQRLKEAVSGDFRQSWANMVHRPGA